VSTNARHAGGSERTGPDEDELFEMLSSSRRRHALHLLKSADEPVELGDIAEQVAAWEYDTDIAEVSYDERKRVYTALQQSHLPKMDDAGVVEFDKNRGVVEPTAALDDVEVYMDVVRGNEIPWSSYYLGLAAAAASLMLAVAVDAWPFTMLSDLSWGVAVVAAFAVSALVHRYYARDVALGRGDTPADLDQ
jgi:predicted transcriptional regulator